MFDWNRISIYLDMAIKRQLLPKLNLIRDTTDMTYIKGPSLLSLWLSSFTPSLNFVDSLKA